MVLFCYDVWGETVNTTSHMESHGIPNRIQVLESTVNKLSSTHSFEKRGEIDVKGIGVRTTYFMNPRLPEAEISVVVETTATEVEYSWTPSLVIPIPFDHKMTLTPICLLENWFDSHSDSSNHPLGFRH